MNRTKFTSEEIKDFWCKQALGHIIPNRGNSEFPDGTSAIDLLVELIGKRSVFEFGCGRGRLASKFPPNRYIGADICKRALAKATETCKQHRFVELGTDFQIPQQDVVLFYTVALHLDNKTLSEALLESHQFGRTLIIAEVMDHRLARPNRMPPAFNRSPEDLIQYAADSNWNFSERFETSYDAYPDTRITFLLFNGRV